MTSASALLPLWNRGAEWERRLAMVREARSFLYLSTFYIEHDSYGLGMLSELVAAQRRGVAVNLLIDGFGQRLGGVLMSSQQRATLDAMLNDLLRAGAIVTTYHPARRLQRWLGGGQHVKIQVSEAGEAIFGSSNLSRSSYPRLERILRRAAWPRRARVARQLSSDRRRRERITSSAIGQGG